MPTTHGQSDGAWLNVEATGPNEVTAGMPLEGFPGLEVQAVFVTRDGRTEAESVTVYGGPVTAKALRAVKLDVLRREAAEILDLAVSAALRDHDIGPRLLAASQTFHLERRPGRRGRGDLFYAAVAAAYCSELEQGNGRDAVARLAKREHLSESQVRSILHEARRRELLTKPRKAGVAGGHLTPKAIELLKGDD